MRVTSIALRILAASGVVLGALAMASGAASAQQAAGAQQQAAPKLTPEQEAWIAEKQKLRPQIEKQRDRDAKSVIPVAERVVSRDRQLFGSVHTETADSLDMMAAIYYMASQFDLAAGCKEEIRQIYAQLYGEKDWRTLGARWNKMNYEHLGNAGRQVQDLVTQGHNLIEQGSALYTKAKYAEALATLEKAREIFRAAYGDDSPPLARALHEIALCRYSLGQIDECYKLLQESAAMYAGWYTTESSQYAFEIQVLANLTKAANSQEAERLFREAIGIYDRIQGFPQLDLALALSRLGNLYLDNGQAARAENMIHRGLEIQEKFASPDSRDFLSAKLFLARALNLQRQFDNAEAIIKAVDEQLARLNQQNSALAAECKNMLSIVSRDRGRPQDAVKYLEQSLAIERKISGENSLNVGILLANLGDNYLDVDDLPHAEETFEQSVAVFRNAVGLRHAGARRSFDRLETVLAIRAERFNQESKHVEARQKLERIRELAVEYFGADHDQVREADDNLKYQTKIEQASLEDRNKLLEADRLEREGRASYNGGKDAEAVEKFVACIELRKALLEPNDLMIARVQLRLAYCYVRLGQNAQAEEQYRLAETGYAAVYAGKSNPSLSYIYILHGVGDLCQQRGDYPAAIDYLTRAQALYRATTGETGSGFFTVTRLLGDSLLASADYPRAEVAFREMAERIAQVYGSQHVDFAYAVRQLGHVHFRLSKLADARKHYEQALAVYQAAGEYYEVTCLGVRSDLAGITERLGNLQQAAAELEPIVAAAREKNARADLPNWMGQLQRVLRRLRRYDEAEKLALERIEMAAQGKNASEMYRCQNELEEVLVDRATYAQGQRNHAETVAVRERLYKQRIERFGEDHWATRDTKAWLAASQQIAALDPEKLAKYHEALDKLAEASKQYNAKRYAEALAAAKQATRQIRDVLGEKTVAYSDALQELAAFHNVVGQRTEAEAVLREVILVRKLATSEKDPAVATVQRELAVNLIAQEKFREAVEVLEEIVRNLAEHYGRGAVDYARAVSLMGSAYLKLGDYAAAREHLDAAQAVLVRYQYSHPGFALDNMMDQVQLLMDLGDIDEAERVNVASGEMVRQVAGETSPSYARVAYNQGRLAVFRKQYEPGEKFLRQALDLYRKNSGDDSTEYAMALAELAQLLYQKQDYDLSEPLYRRAAELFEERGGNRSPHYLSSQTMLATIYRAQGKFDRAEKIYREMIDARREVLGADHPSYQEGLFGLTVLLMRTERWDEAATAARECLESAERHLESTSAIQTDRQRSLSINNLRAALDRYLSVAPLAKLAPDATYAHTLKWKGALFARQRKLRELRQNAQAAELFARWGNVTGSLATLSLRVPYPDERPLWSGRIASLALDKDRLERQLLALAKTGTKEAPVGLDEIRGALPADTALVDFVQYVHYERNEAGLLSFSPRLAAFIVRTGQPVARVDLGAVEPLGTAIDQWRAATLGEIEGRGGEQVDYKTVAAQLKTAIWAPLAPHLDGVRTVLEVPDGPLGKFPLAALPGDEEGTFLIENRAFAVLAVPAMLPELFKRPPEAAAEAEAGSLLLVGNIDYGTPPTMLASTGDGVRRTFRSQLPYHFTDLEGFLDEIKDIRRYFQDHYRQGQTLLLERRKANELSFRREAPRHRWVHVATHGFFAPDVMQSAYAAVPQARVTQSALEDSSAAANAVPAAVHEGLMSGLALCGANEVSQEGQDDGILSALEVATLDLSGVEMAVLSACETGLGTSVSGEGVVGLQRAFQVAGARTTVTSLWPVDDRATRLLMARFYRNLWNRSRPMARIEALNEAQRWFLKASRNASLDLPSESRLGANSERLPDDFNLPAYWAPFVLSGDWR